MGLATTGLTLALLHFRILLVNDVQAAFPTNNLAVGSTLFKGSTGFHSAIISCIGTKFDLSSNRKVTCPLARGHRAGF